MKDAQDFFGKYPYKVSEKQEKVLQELAENFDDLVAKINQKFEDSRNSVVEFVQDYIYQVYESGADKYEWFPSYNPWDRSGEIKYVGALSADIRLFDFFEEYNGRKEPTFLSGQGWCYTTYGDDLSFETLEFGEEIMRSEIEPFMHELDKEEKSDIFDIAHDFFYDATTTNEFFFYEGVLDFLGIEEDSDITVKDFMKDYKNFLSLYC